VHIAIIIKLKAVLVRCYSEDIMKELQNVTLSDITVIATLGVGGFGRVELVRMCCTCIDLIRGKSATTASRCLL